MGLWTGCGRVCCARNCGRCLCRNVVSIFARAQVRSSRILSTPGGGGEKRLREKSFREQCVFILFEIFDLWVTHTNFYGLLPVECGRILGWKLGWLYAELVLVLNNTQWELWSYIHMQQNYYIKTSCWMQFKALPAILPPTIFRVYNFPGHEQ